jgi:penicillin-binding protein 1A
LTHVPSLTLFVTPYGRSFDKALGSRLRVITFAVGLAAALPSPLHGQAAEGQGGEPWRIVSPPQSSVVLARDGSLIGEIGREWRTLVGLKTLPPYVAQAFIAVEDQRFYQHDGVDLVGVAGALKDALRGRVRGASTITQLLVGNMHPDIIDRTDRGLGRKLREQQAAREMERHYTKEQILEAFLNQIHFGRRYYGVESAARHYFGKPASKLTLAEAATLAALPKGPALYDPVRHPERARTRRNTVLALMAEQKYITPQQSAAAQREPIKTAPAEGFVVSAPYFADVVKVQAQRASVDVTQGGFRVHTTLDPLIQRAAHEALTSGIAELEQRPGYRHPKYEAGKQGTDYLQGIVVAMDPFTGDVRPWSVGGITPNRRSTVP